MSAQSIYDQRRSAHSSAIRTARRGRRSDSSTSLRLGRTTTMSGASSAKPSRTIGNHTTPASFTLHQGDFGSAGVVVLKVFKTFSVGSPRAFTIVERPKPGMVRVLDRAGCHAKLLHLAADRTAAQAWLASHRYSDAMLDEVIDDGAASGSGEGRAA